MHNLAAWGHERRSNGIVSCWASCNCPFCLSRVRPPLLLCSFCGSRHPFVMCRYMGLENNIMQKHGTIIHESSHNKNVMWCKLGLSLTLFHSLCFIMGVERVYVSVSWTVCFDEISTFSIWFGISSNWAKGFNLKCPICMFILFILTNLFFQITSLLNTSTYWSTYELYVPSISNLVSTYASDDMMVGQSNQMDPIFQPNYLSPDRCFFSLCWQ